MKIATIIPSLLAAADGAFGALQEVTSFGTNPTNVQMFISVPNKLGGQPAIIVALHGCGGNAQSWYTQTGLSSYEESKNFITIVPQTKKHSSCWDVNNAGSLTHGGSGDATGIISMIDYTLTKYGANKAKVFTMGGSSGAMMTNVLVGSYPDVFEAGASYSGVPFACFAGSLGEPTPAGSNQTCANGLTHTADDWARFVYNAYPGYSGKRPRVLVAHGLSDSLVKPVNGYEQLKQWSTVLGVTNTKNVTGSAVEEGSQYTQLVYSDETKLVGYLGKGVGHIAPPVATVMLKFFGLF